MDLELADLFKAPKAAKLHATLVPEKDVDSYFPTSIEHIKKKSKKSSNDTIKDVTDTAPNKDLARKPERRVETEERKARTLFVGNVPISVVSKKSDEKEFKRLFSQIGIVESVRFRSLTVTNSLSKRNAFITGQLHEKRESCNAYVVMEALEAAEEAREKLNATLWKGRHLRVDCEHKNLTKKSIFIGNLPMEVDEEVVWNVFGAKCGAIEYVRLIRDKDTGLGKGFGYVAFQDKSSVELALQLNGCDCGGRPIRISKCAKQGYQKNKKERIVKIKAQKEAANPSKYQARPEKESRKKSFKTRFDEAKALPKLEAKTAEVPVKKAEKEVKLHPAAQRLEKKKRLLK